MSEPIFQLAVRGRHYMKFICLGYMAPGRFESLSDDQRNAIVDQCFEYDDKLRAKGHFASGEGLEGPEATRTLSLKNRKVVVSDGPYAETKEHAAGLLVLEARDIQEAVQLMSQHPGLQMGPWEIRPVADLNEMIRQSELRRRRKPAAAGN